MARVIDRSKCVCGGKPFQHENDPEGCWCATCMTLRYAGKEPCQVFRRDPYGMPDRSLSRKPPVRDREAEDVAKKVARLRPGTRKYEMFQILQQAGEAGKTDDELETTLARSHQTVSATRNQLMNDGLIVDSGKRRLTRWHNEAIVWVVAHLG